MNVVSLLGNLHGWFKTSSADMVELREELVEQLHDELEEVLDQFFLRHVDARWLESQRCLQRLLDHFTSTVEYFTVYVPNSDPAKMKMFIMTAKFASEILNEKQEELARHMGKKKRMQSDI